MVRRLSCLLILGLILSSYPVHTEPVATEDGLITQVGLSPLEISDFPRIHLKGQVQVNGKLNRPLSRKDFLLSEDGVPIDEFQINIRSQPVQFGLVLDTSGSIRDFIDQIKEGAESFINAMESEDEAMIVRFANEAELILPLSDDRRQLKNRVNLLQSHGGTKLYDGLHLALKNLEGDNPCLVLFTDGKDQFRPDDKRPFSKHQIEDVIALARSKRIPVHVIGVGSQTDEKILGGLAKWTGGQYLKTLSPEDVAGLYLKLANLVRKAYYVSYISPNPKKDGKLREVKLLERHSEVSDSRHYLVGESQEKASRLSAYQADWFSTGAALGAGQISVLGDGTVSYNAVQAQKFGVESLQGAMKIHDSWKANWGLKTTTKVRHRTKVRGPKIKVDTGVLKIRKSVTSIDLSNPFNPNIKVNPGGVDYGGPEIDVDPGSVDSETSVNTDFDDDDESYLDDEDMDFSAP